jgi:hypothetical protein
MKNWYAKCRTEIEKLYGEDADLFCDLLAATSPRKQVKANWKLATLIYTEVVAGTEICGRRWSKLKNIPGIMPCHRNNIRAALVGEPLSGRKVRAFAANLKGDLSQVTVDVWIGRAYGHEKITEAVYDFIEAEIKYCASLLGMKPAEFQAELWCRQIRAAGKTPKSFLAAIDYQMKLF